MNSLAGNLSQNLDLVNREIQKTGYSSIAYEILPQRKNDEAT